LRVARRRPDVLLLFKKGGTSGTDAGQSRRQLPFMKRPGEEMLEETCHEGNVDLVHLKNNDDAAHGIKK
jgi:hypothetical protein